MPDSERERDGYTERDREGDFIIAADVSFINISMRHRNVSAMKEKKSEK